MASDAAKEMDELARIMGAGIETDDWVQARGELESIIRLLAEVNRIDAGTEAKSVATNPEKVKDELGEAEEQAKQTGQVFAQMDDKLRESIDNMTAGIELMVAAMDQMNDKATHMVGVINRMFLQSDNKEFFGNTQAGIELLVESMGQLEAQAAQTQAELTRIGGVNTGISEDAMNQLIKQSMNAGRKQQADRERTLNQLYTEQRARLKEIYDLHARMRKGEGDAGNQTKRIAALNAEYASAKKQMESMANSAEKLKKLEDYETDLSGKNKFDEDKKTVDEL